MSVLLMVKSVREWHFIPSLKFVLISQQYRRPSQCTQETMISEGCDKMAVLLRQYAKRPEEDCATSIDDLETKLQDCTVRLQ